MAYDLKITVFNNKDYEQSFNLKDANNVNYNLTGCSLLFGISDSVKVITSHDTNIALTNKCIFVTDATTGLINLKLPFAILKNIVPGTYFHELILIDTDGKRTGIWSGQIVVKRGSV